MCKANNSDPLALTALKGNRIRNCTRRVRNHNSEHSRYHQWPIGLPHPVIPY